MIYLILFYEFFLIGLFTFGGGYAMIPIVRSTVLARGWMTDSLFLDFIAVAESTPGPIAINMATFVGASQAGVLGSIVATLGVVLPSFIIIVLIASLLRHILDNKHVKAFLNGIKPVIVGLILSTGFILVVKALGFVDFKAFNFSLEGIIIFGILALVFFGTKFIRKKKMNSILFILLSSAVALLVFITSNLIQ